MRRRLLGGVASLFLLLLLLAACGSDGAKEAVGPPAPSPDGAPVLTETWTGPDGSSWPADWTDRSINGPGSSTISDDRGRQQADAGLVWHGDLIDGPDLGDQEILVSFEVSDPSVEQYADVGYRMGTGVQDPNAKPGNGYVLELEFPWDAGRLWVFDEQSVGRGDGWREVAAVQPAGLTEPGRYWIRIRAVGDQHQARWWRDGEAEPSDWLIDTTDGTHAAGRNWLVTYGGRTTPGQVDWDDLTISEVTTPG